MFSLLRVKQPATTTRSTTTTSILRRRTFLPTPSSSSSSSTKLQRFNSTTKNGGPVSLDKLSESFIDGTSADYVEQQYRAWKKSPESVHNSWAAYFRNVEAGAGPGQAYMSPPTLYPGSTPRPARQQQQQQFGSAAFVAASATHDNWNAINLVNSYRSLGHRYAKLDPLGLSATPNLPELDYKTYGFTEADLNKEFTFSNTALFPFSGQKLSAILQKLKSVYCDTVGFEYSHLLDATQRQWLQDKIEAGIKTSLSKEDKINLIDRLIWSDSFENYLHMKFGSDKRFGLDGCETLIPGMKTLIDTAADFGVESVVIGMPHRGRLNVLANVIRKPIEHIIKEFAKTQSPQEELRKDFSFSGDVKYHLGTSYDRTTRSGKNIHLSLMSNPSHLEAVDPLVEGKVRAKQFYAKDTNRTKALSLQLHGDAAFAGQGIVYETFQMSGLENYTTGGTAHIVVNNQIGFTTDPSSGRSTTYCTDVAKGFSVPVFHVNGDDAEAVIAVCNLAAEWRQTFHRDLVIDLVGYRRHGHNELDEPKYTQPLMYAAIDKHPSSVSLYSQKIISEGVMTQAEIDKLKENVHAQLDNAFKNAPSYKPKQSHWLESKWKSFKGPEQLSRIRETGVPMEVLKKVGSAIYTIPDDYIVHPIIHRAMKQKKAMIEAGEPVDWATAEALAFGTLLLEDNHVRLSGQDVERGTFSHRHAVITDQRTGRKHVPLNHIDSKQAQFIACNSPLSEYGVMGFELGYSLENPNALVCWEAQFGDFVNGAQIILDQFLAAGEQKWYRQSGLVLLLPHGYEGQGPEHSSARLERFLQLCDSDPYEIPDMNPATTTQIQESNMQVVNCSTPANYYHVLRRQIHRDFRKPLVVMSPKVLLRHPAARSPLLDFDDKDGSTHFERVIGEVNPAVQSKDPKSIRKVIFCSGKVYYELAEERAARKIDNVAIVRIEQLAPFPFDLVQEQLKHYPKAEIVWCQEEPQNQGAWSFIAPHLTTAMKGITNQTPKYAGRPVSASPAVGSNYQHKIEQANLIAQALA